MSEPTTLRDSISAALEEPEEQVQAPVAAPEPAAAQGEMFTEQASDAAPTNEPKQDLNELAEGEKPEGDGNERDEKGRFKAKQLAEDGVKPGPKAGPKPQGERAPASWRPDVREHWAQLPDPVRAEIARRESEVQRTLQDTAEARKTAEAVMRTIAPYEMFIKAENSTPLQAIDNLMSTAAKLRTGTAPELAQLVAGLVNQFGVGRFGNAFIEQLDSALAGRAAPNNVSSDIDQVINQRLAPLQSMLSQFQQAQQQQQQQVTQQAQSEVQRFLEQAEFGNDVREDMADIIEAANRRGQTISLSDAYKKACLMSDSVRSVLIQRQKAAGVQQKTQVAQKARQAAVSVSGSAPVGALQQPATDVRSAIEAAIVQNGR